ncbi:hypothetical protein SAMN02745148_00456 [Modicisalibacter ilicicola DSM 19980]|uniref:Uncharacterized protein n=1 Tax=Modicisalibacter ilicicola DSM 19980 TaxID=1121942 RepID=A0A1M4THY2_9GAMM|nr:hypothetical protein [Halomonas ilicicola]SHE44071.1 hypothetical protein SAMN02745148_00456 [Halomonas ilicicola DSM 19980]
MVNSVPEASGRRPLGGWIWLALGLYVAFFANVAVQSHWPGLIEVAPVAEACLLVVATACFISGCLSIERRRAVGE